MRATSINQLDGTGVVCDRLFRKFTDYTEQIFQCKESWRAYDKTGESMTIKKPDRLWADPALGSG
jgi:hypothetical protein